MVLEWREHEHGEVEEVVRADLMAQQALCACGLYKFWCLRGLNIDEYIAVYCYPDMEKVGSQIPTNSIHVLGLKAILLTLGRIHAWLHSTRPCGL